MQRGDLREMIYGLSGSAHGRLSCAMVKKSAPVEIYPLRYTAGDLAAVPEDDALFFLMCGQLQNDIVILSRQVILARMEDGSPEPVRMAAMTVNLVNMRMLAGRLAEGWDLIRDRFQRLFREYGDVITPAAVADLKSLNVYFANDCLIRTLRNKIAAHIDQAVMRDAYKGIEAERNFTDYLARMEGNTIFYSGEILMVEAIHRLVQGADLQASLNALGEEVIRIARLEGSVVREYLRAFAQRHLEPQLRALVKGKIVIEDQPLFDDFIAPVFLAGDDEREA